MWTGFAAAFLGMAYALVRFSGLYHLRRLHEELSLLRHESARQRHKLEALRQRLAVAQATQHTRQRQAEEGRRANRQLHARLQALLPPAQQQRLERCMQLQPVSHVQELRLLQELGWVRPVAAALAPLTLLRLALPPRGDTEQTLAVMRFVDRLSAEDVCFHGPQEGILSCVLTDPAPALGLLRDLVRDLPAASAAGLRAVLQTGIAVTGEEDELKRLLARTLQRSRQLLEQAPPGSALLNQEARQRLADADISPFDEAAQLHIVSWAPTVAAAPPQAGGAQ